MSLWLALKLATMLFNAADLGSSCCSGLRNVHNLSSTGFPASPVAELPGEFELPDVSPPPELPQPASAPIITTVKIKAQSFFMFKTPQSFSYVKRLSLLTPPITP